MTWQTPLIKHFNQLTLDQLYDLVQLRTQIFVCEQNCTVVNEFDGVDKQADHVMIYHAQEQRLDATLRLFLSPHNPQQIIIGRVATRLQAREQGLGSKMLKAVIPYVAQHYPDHEIMMHAQLSRQDWYQKRGFVPRGQVFVEDDIDHIEMFMPWTHVLELSQPTVSSAVNHPCPATPEPVSSCPKIFSVAETDPSLAKALGSNSITEKP